MGRQFSTGGGVIYSATENDAEDIAAVAVAALTYPGFANGDFILTGPDCLSYDDVAALISTAAGREIQHRRLSAENLSEWFVKGGIPAAFAPALAAMDTAISLGAEDRTTQEVFKLTGRSPGSFEAFVTRNATVWEKHA